MNCDTILLFFYHFLRRNNSQGNKLSEVLEELSCEAWEIRDTSGYSNQVEIQERKAFVWKSDLISGSVKGRTPPRPHACWHGQFRYSHMRLICPSSCMWDLSWYLACLWSRICKLPVLLSVQWADERMLFSAYLRLNSVTSPIRKIQIFFWYL